MKSVGGSSSEEEDEDQETPSLAEKRSGDKVDSKKPDKSKFYHDRLCISS